ncbi:MAG: N-6 DNA methylase, partial [Verrucomicrobiae bacterium]|nr:N-6 DNA methylase [Verrucomicrobiae bacterium]
MPPSDDKADEPAQPPLRGKLRKRSDASSRDAEEVSVGKAEKKPPQSIPAKLRKRSEESSTDDDEISIGKMDKVWNHFENLASGTGLRISHKALNRLIHEGKAQIDFSADNPPKAILDLDKNPSLLNALEGWIGEDTLFGWLDQMRGDTDVSRFDFAVAVAALMCLRWIEADEAESRAIIEFEEGEFSEKAEPVCILERWADTDWNYGKHDLGDELLRILELGSAGEAASYAPKLKPGLRIFSRIDRPMQAALVQRMLMLDPTTLLGRRLGEMLIKSILKWLEKSEKGYAGEFYTSEHLVDLMVSLGDPNPGERVYDPCFGTGSLLAGAARRAIDKTKTTDTDGWGQIRRDGIYGREINPLVFILGLARIVYSGVDLPRLEVGNSLEVEGFNG